MHCTDELTIHNIKQQVPYLSFSGLPYYPSSIRSEKAKTKYYLDHINSDSSIRITKQSWSFLNLIERLDQ